MLLDREGLARAIAFDVICEHFNGKLRSEEIDAIRATIGRSLERRASVQQAGGGEVGEGWVAVPREPTEAMLDAGVLDHRGEVSFDEATAVWVAMIAAAPSPPAGIRHGGEQPDAP
jgi:hypothetical protein